jgi:hypothetical protein
MEEMSSTPAQYLDLYRAEGRELRARRGELASDHPSVTITFSLSFARLAEANPVAADLVRACAFLAPDAIPEEIFTQAPEQWGKPLAWLDTVRDARRFGLLHRDAESKTLYIHRLVQEVVKDQMDAETLRAWAERAVEAMNNAFPDVQQFQNWPHCEQMLPHARVVASHIEAFRFESAAAGRLLNRSGSYLMERAQYAEAEPMWLGALAMSEKKLGLDHQDTASSLNNLAALPPRTGNLRRRPRTRSSNHRHLPQ